MNNNRGFTEAVPLSLSSMAHMTLPLEDGVLDGLKQVLQHTLLSCVNYARASNSSNNKSSSSIQLSDIATTPWAWQAQEWNGPAIDAHAPLPPSLQKLDFQHYYHRTAFLYLQQDLKKQQESSNDSNVITKQDELNYVQDYLQGEEDWMTKSPALGRVTLCFASPALLTKEELEGTDRDEDTPPCVLYKVLVEYRSLPPTGNKAAIQAEELSMLSFGGSVDDDVKYGALASLYDPHAKYVVEIFSVRGKRYKFDLMDSTLSDGTVPRLPSRSRVLENAAALAANTATAPNTAKPSTSTSSNTPHPTDPFVKSLCVTVSDHTTNPPVAAQPNVDNTIDSNDNNDDGEDAKPSSPKKQKLAPSSSVKTKIHVTLEGNLRCTLKQIPPPHLYSYHLQDSFLSLHATPPALVRAMPSGQSLLLDPRQAGRVYLNGKYLFTWGADSQVATHFPALFGMDLHSIPYWHGRLSLDYNTLKRTYAQLWQDVLIDARMMDLQIGQKLLSRLISGKDPNPRDIQEHGDDDDDDDNVDLEGDPDEDDDMEEDSPRVNTDMDCLESQVMQSAQYDPVGICAKALATRFERQYGRLAFPCLVQEMDWVKDRLPGRIPVAVPQRVINVLRRGGYFDTRRTSEEVWFATSRPVLEAENGGSPTAEQQVVQGAVAYLKASGCQDVGESVIVFFSGEGIEDPVPKKGLVRFNRGLRQYHVNEFFMDMDLNLLLGEESDWTEDQDLDARAYLLGTHIAKEHPDGTVWLRYLLKHSRTKAGMPSPSTRT